MNGFSNKFIITRLLFLVVGWSEACLGVAVDVSPDKHENFIIKNVNIITMDEKDSVLEDHAVLVESGLIKRITRSKNISTKGIDVVDGEGKYLLPALIDAHVHIWDIPELSAYLAHGIGMVRNASGMPYHLKLQKRINEGTLVGPRLITTGPILNSQGPNTQINHQVVSNEIEAAEAVKKQYEAGFRHLKVYSNLTLPAYESIVSEAKRLGMTLMGHTPEGFRDKGIPHAKPFRIPFSTLLDDGFVSIEHMESIVWHGLSDNLNIKEIRWLAKQIAESKTPVTPTLIAHHNLVKVSQKSDQYLNRPGTKMLNPFILAMEQDSFDHWSAQPSNSRVKFDDFYGKATKIFQEEGVVLLAGTDSGIFTNIPGVSLIDELVLMVSGGLTPLEALKTATSNPATAFGYGKKLGKIKEGYLADLILVDENPMDNISHLMLLSGIYLQDKWFDKDAISVLKKNAETTSFEGSKERILKGLSAQGVILDM